MSQPRQLRIRTVVTYVPAIASAFVGAAGLMVLIGWALHAELLKTLLYPGHVAMNPATAIALIFLAASLWLLRNEPPSRTARLFANLLTAIVLLIVAARFCDLMFDTHLHVDQRLFHSLLRENVISPNTAAALLMLAVALLILDWRSGERFHPAQVFTIVAGCIGLLSLTGYIYGTAELYGFQNFKPMALNTAITLILLAIGILCHVPGVSRCEACSATRWAAWSRGDLIPAAFLVPLLAGKVQILGVRLGLYRARFWPGDAGADQHPGVQRADLVVRQRDARQRCAPATLRRSAAQQR